MIFLRRWGFEQSAACSCERGLQHRRDELRVCGELFLCGIEHGDDGAIDFEAGGTHDRGAINVRTDGVEGYADFAVFHFCLEKLGDQGGCHVLKRGACLLAADGLDGGNDVVHVALQRRAEESAFVGEVLVEGADGDSGAGGDSGGGETLFADGDQNLKCCLKNGVYAGGGARLHGRFSRLQNGLGVRRQMRSPNLKLSSSNDYKPRESTQPDLKKQRSEGWRRQ